VAVDRVQQSFRALTDGLDENLQVPVPEMGGQDTPDLPDLFPG
jgi:hypothetical protein